MLNTAFTDARRSGRLDDGVKALTKKLGQVTNAQAAPVVEALAEHVHSVLLGLADEPSFGDDRLGEWASKANEYLKDTLPALRQAVAGEPSLADAITNLMLSALADVAAPIDVSKVVDAPSPSERDAVEPKQADLVDGEAQDEPADDDGAPTLQRDPSAVQKLTVAAQAAQDAADEAKKLVRVLCPSNGHEGPERKQERSALLALVMNRNAALKQVLELAGRLTAVSKAKLKETANARAKVTGLTRGDDLSRVLAPELAGLSSPATRGLTLAKIAQGEAMQYRLGGKERVGKGPMLVFLDVSGSMSRPFGEGKTRYDWARAVALTALTLCQEQRRDLYVTGFEGHVCWSYWFGADGRSAHVQGHKGWQTTPRGAAMFKILASQATGCSTDFDPPLCHALSVLKATPPTKRPDVLFITDGEAPVSAKVKAAVLEAKKVLGMNVNAVMIGEAISAKNALLGIMDSFTSLLQADGGYAFAKVLTL
jgi:hypothetical protein